MYAMPCDVIVNLHIGVLYLRPVHGLYYTQLAVNGAFLRERESVKVLGG